MNGVPRAITKAELFVRVLELAGRMDPLDPWRAAKLLLDEHHDGAAAWAIERRREVQRLRIESRMVFWNKVLEAIVELRRETPQPGEFKH